MLGTPIEQLDQFICASALVWSLALRRADRGAQISFNY